jgi:hypothetical protein
LIAVPGEVLAYLLKRQPDQFVNFVVGLELAVLGRHEVVGNDLRSTLAIRN